MISRYEHPDIADIFSDVWRYSQWRHTELDYMVGRRRFHPEKLERSVYVEASTKRTPTPAEVAERETATGHDVVAFLQAWCQGMSAEVQSHVHYGLTSSDLVDNTLFRQLTSSGRVILVEAQNLHRLIQAMAYNHRDVTRAGRTHGQLAEPTKLGWRFSVWGQTLSDLCDEWDAWIENQVNVMKSPGAVGDMQVVGDAVAFFVAEYRRQTLVPSTQVIPRQRLLAWAGWCLRLVSVVEEIALEIRLSSRSEVGEMREHATLERVGSSAMPHKRNPVGSEQLSGLGRVARGYFASLAETAGALHNERDISNSSVERIVVPDLAHLAAYSLTKIAQILETIVVYPGAMSQNAGKTPVSTAVLAGMQDGGVPYLVAHEQLRKPPIIKPL